MLMFGMLLSKCFSRDLALYRSMKNNPNTWGLRTTTTLFAHISVGQEPRQDQLDGSILRMSAGAIYSTAFSWWLGWAGRTRRLHSHVWQLGAPPRGSLGFLTAW